jgi:pilus assembly protein Flp/PilA
MSIVDRMFAQILTVAYGIKNDEEGQGLAEYGLILALIAVVCVAALKLLASGVGNTLNSITSNL